VDTDLDHGTRYQELYPAAEDRPWSRPSQDRDIDAERCVDPTSIAPIAGVDEIETLRKWSPSRKTHGFTRLGHRAGKSRGGYATRQRSGCCYLPRHRSPVAGLGPLQLDSGFYGSQRGVCNNLAILASFSIPLTPRRLRVRHSGAFCIRAAPEPRCQYWEELRSKIGPCIVCQL
jgi:hypothetical protein